MADQTEDPVARLKKLDTCAVSDALDSLDLAPAVTGILRLATDKAIAGRVMTVKLGTEARDDGPPRHLGTAAVEAAQQGDILVIEQRTGVNAAGWGGVLSNAAQVKGIAGIIVDGPARDIEESRELGFAVFARMATARTARGRIFEVDFNCEITVGDVTVAPGDMVIADASAVVFVPAARADEVLAVAERITEKERLMTAAVRRGDAVSQVMGADYESMLNPPDKAK